MNTLEVDWRMTWKPTLDVMPWRSIKCTGRGDKMLFMKSNIARNSYEVMVTDLHTIWYESLSESQIKKRMASLNPKIEAPLDTVMSHLKSIIGTQDEGTHYSITFPKPLVVAGIGGSEDEKILLNIRSKLLEVKFIWKINGDTSFPSMFVKHVTEPLMLVVSELTRRQEHLMEIIAKKDKQIEDYKEQGAKCSRKNLETSKFEDTEFNTLMNMSEEFEEAIKLGITHSFKPDVSEAYKQIMMKKAWLERPVEDPPAKSSTTSSVPSLMDETFDKRMPPSLLDLDLGLGAIRLPGRRADGMLDSQESEMNRRHDLEKRMAEDSDTGRYRKKKKALF